MSESSIDFWRYDMDIDFKKLAPWNWFKKEQEERKR